MKRLVVTLALLMSVAVIPASAGVKHTIKGSARPYKAVGHVFKLAAKGVVKATATTATFSFAAFDAAVIDPFGVALQALADGVDMAIAQPLEALPQPLNKIGVGVHYVYLGIDKVGEILAK